GLYATIGIQAALLERTQSGKGQKVDMSLYDSAVSSLVNIGSNYLMSGDIPKPLGNHHANIVPYQTFDTSDGQMVIAVGNDNQFKAFCHVLNKPELANDERFLTNPDRVKYREVITTLIQEVMVTRPTAYWQEKCNANNIPCGPIQNLEEVVNDPQLQSRNMFVEKDHPVAGKINMVGSPLKLSRTPVSIKHYPPEVGEHNEEILNSLQTKND